MEKIENKKINNKSSNIQINKTMLSKNDNKITANSLDYEFEEENMISKKKKSLKKNVIEYKQNKKIKKLNVLDLFCGCGGMTTGLKEAGLEIIAGIDIWDVAIKSYESNHNHKAICADLTKLTPDNFKKTYNINTDIDIIVGGPPCFVAGTMILTDTGYKQIEKVTLDDKLMTHTGKFQDIVNLQTKIYSGDLYNLDIKYHPNIIKCTEEHPFYVRERKKIWNNEIKKYEYKFNNPCWKLAKDLSKNDYFGMIINDKDIIPELNFYKKRNDNSYEQINIKIDNVYQWFFMGYFVGNDTIEGINKTENYDFEKNKKISYTHFVWFNILQQFGKYKNKKLIPEWVHDAPKKYIHEFIIGYMTAVGNIKKNGKYCIRTISFDIALGLQRLFLKLGYIASIKKKFHEKTKIIKYIIEIQLNKELVSTFIENNYIWFEPFSIKKTRVGEDKIQVYNYEVKTDNSYIVENIIAHNCQGFSIAGKRDKKDPRNSLFMEYCKYLDFFKPKAFIMENVIGILSMKTEEGESVIDIITERLGKDYNYRINKLYASDFEVPQNRRRTIIVGIRKDLEILPEEIKPVLSKNERIPVKTILENRDNIDEKYFLSEKAIKGINAKKEKSKLNGKGFGAQFLDPEKPSYTIPARYWKDGYDALVKYDDDTIRRLTISELKKIQSFPNDYILKGNNKEIIMQIGNAVACKFAYHLGKYIMKTLQ